LTANLDFLKGLVVLAKLIRDHAEHHQNLDSEVEKSNGLKEARHSEQNGKDVEVRDCEVSSEPRNDQKHRNEEVEEDDEGQPHKLEELIVLQSRHHAGPIEGR